MNSIKAHSNRFIIAGLVVIQLVALSIVALVGYELYTDWHDDSIEIYYVYSTRFLDGEMPFRDFAMEYPPLALIAFCLPHLIAFGKELSIDQYTNFYLFVNVLFSLIVSIIVLSLFQKWQPKNRRIVEPIALLTVALVICAPILPWRYDLFPALLTILSLYLLIINKPVASGISIGIAVAAKLYPAVLIPVFMLYLLSKADLRSLKRFIIGGGISATTLIPFIVLAPNSFTSFLSYHQQRGLEVESLMSGFILLGKMVGIIPATIVYNYTAFHLSSPYADIILRWLPYVAITLFAIIYASCYIQFKKAFTANNKIPTDSLLAYSVLALLIFLITNKVFSPQYIIWILPFFPLMRLRYASLFLIISFLTIMIFPVGFKLIIDANQLGIILLNLRNGLIVVLTLWIFIDYFPFSKRSSISEPALSEEI
ncbi:MAG: DUF2029 domain-containing protein [Anaerolineales bacterium]|nr:DUF2029 domain-containing protein [Chloroflexota bacterium]MBL6980245.1 DUF2029 domain-containing protein [Anaerolineales bacterium]